ASRASTSRSGPRMGITVFKRSPTTCGCATTSARKGAYGGAVTIAPTRIASPPEWNADRRRAERADALGGRALRQRSSAARAVEHTRRPGGFDDALDGDDAFLERADRGGVLARAHVVAEVVETTPAPRDESHGPIDCAGLVGHVDDLLRADR